MKIKKPVLCIAYYYENDYEEKMNSDVFIADSTKSLEKQFSDYSKYAYGYKVSIKNIDGVYILEEIEDKNGNNYKIIIK